MDTDKIIDLLRSVPRVELSEARRAELLNRIQDLGSTSGNVANLESESPGVRTSSLNIRRILLVSTLWLASLLGEGAFFWQRSTVQQEEWKPDRVEVSKSDHVAYLVARNSRVVHAWGSPAPKGIRSGTLVHSSARGGQGPLAAIGYSDDSENPWPHALAVFDVSKNLNQPIWTASLEASDIPADLRARRPYTPAQFSVTCCSAADVFPELPGPELILVFQHSVYSQCAVQVRDLDGKLLTQFWHDGNVNQLYWMLEGRQIICAGFNGEAPGTARGLLDAAQPHVVFAVTPTFGQSTPRWINTVDHTGGIEPNWYWCIIAPQLVPDLSDVRITRPFEGADARSNVAVCLDFLVAEPAPGYSVQLDARGSLVPGSIKPNDPFNEAVEKHILPPASDFRLEPLPPIKIRDGVWLPGSR